MSNGILEHLGRHKVAVVALCCSLAALGLSLVAVTRQAGVRWQPSRLKDGSLTPAAFDRQLINGYVAGWAVIGASGRVLAGAGYLKATRMHLHDVYVIAWKADLEPSCATVATVDESYPEAATEHVRVPGGDVVPFVAGYAVADTNARLGYGTDNGTTVDTFNQRGQPTPLAFDVAVIC